MYGGPWGSHWRCELTKHEHYFLFNVQNEGRLKFFGVVKSILCWGRQDKRLTVQVKGNPKAPFSLSSTITYDICRNSWQGWAPLQSRCMHNLSPVILVLILPTTNGWKAEWTLEGTSWDSNKEGWNAVCERYSLRYAHSTEVKSPKWYFLFYQIHAMCAGGGKLYSAGSDQAIISWNLENLTLHKRVEVCSINML